MFKWWKKKREIKKIMSLKNSLNKAIAKLETVRDNTIVGDSTYRDAQYADGFEMDIAKVDITSIVVSIHAIIHEIDREIDDRTRERDPLFPEKSDE